MALSTEHRWQQFTDQAYLSVTSALGHRYAIVNDNGYHKTYALAAGRYFPEHIFTHHTSHEAIRYVGGLLEADFNVNENWEPEYV